MLSSPPVTVNESRLRLGTMICHRAVSSDADTADG